MDGNEMEDVENMTTGKTPVLENVPPEVVRAHRIACESRQNSYSPYSNFKVGAALLSGTGEIVGGCNVENASYGGAVCAERVAIVKAVSSGLKSFTDIVVVTDSTKPAYPCALCLQTMAEFFARQTKIWIADLKMIRSVHSFADLLPHPFGPRELEDARIL